MIRFQYSGRPPTSIIVVFAFIASIAMFGYGRNIYLFTQMKDEPITKMFVMRAIGLIPVTPIGVVLGYIDNDKEETKMSTKPRLFTIVNQRGEFFNGVKHVGGQFDYHFALFQMRVDLIEMMQETRAEIEEFYTSHPLLERQIVNIVPVNFS